MTHLVFMLEEPSMAELLKVLLPKMLPHQITFQLIPHEGKHDLEKSLPRKLRAWRMPGVRFVVVRDQDSADCIVIKERLTDLCRQAGREDTLVRIACPHLEAWFIGDLGAVEAAFNLKGLAFKQRKRKFQNPDMLANAEEELRKLVPAYQKISGSRAIAPHISFANNASRSFQNFILGVNKIIAARTIHS